MSAATTYKTKQKDLILNCLIQNKDKHVTVDEIIFSLRKAKDAVGKTTVYRYLDKLVSQGTVRKYFIEEGAGACYQYIDTLNQCHEHFHLKCVDCGELIHLECRYLDQMYAHVLSNHNFHIDQSKTVLYGKCKGCSEKN